jgi:hypothetical protein
MSGDTYPVPSSGEILVRLEGAASGTHAVLVANRIVTAAIAVLIGRRFMMVPLAIAAEGNLVEDHRSHKGQGCPDAPGDPIGDVRVDGR